MEKMLIEQYRLYEKYIDGLISIWKEKTREMQRESMSIAFDEDTLSNIQYSLEQENRSLFWAIRNCCRDEDTQEKILIEDESVMIHRRILFKTSVLMCYYRQNKEYIESYERNPLYV